MIERRLSADDNMREREVPAVSSLPEPYAQAGPLGLPNHLSVDVGHRNSNPTLTPVKKKTPAGSVQIGEQRSPTDERLQSDWLIFPVILLLFIS